MPSPPPTPARVAPARPGPRRRRLARFLAGRGSLGRPGSDLARLPVGFDPGGISLVEGLRAAFAFAIPLLANEWLEWTPLLTMALAANLACFCDAGGPTRARLSVLAAFSVIGGVLWGGFGLIVPFGPLIVVPLACLAIFACTYARVWGVQEQAAGNVLVVVLCISLDRPLDPAQAAVTAAMFMAGGLWATLLALGLWRLSPYGPTQRAVAEVWLRLAGLAEDLRRLAALPGAGAGASSASPAFDGHARAHRRGVRERIETARRLILDLARSRERVSDRTALALLRIEAAEQCFAALIAVADLVEGERDPGRRWAAARLMRRLRPLLAVIARAIREDTPLDLPRMERACARAARAAGLASPGNPAAPGLDGLGARILERVRIAAKLSARDGFRPGGALVGGARVTWRARRLGPLRTHLTLASANLRHALRASVAAAPALAATLVWAGPFTHWLVMTMVLTMQPFYAATWQRALERIGGTVLGGLIGAGLAHLATTPLAQAALILPLSIVGFAARQVSYGVFIACLTPLVVMLVEVIEPGHGGLEVAGMRALFTLAGGAIAVASCLVLWPVWEPEQVRIELARALGAHARFARAVLEATAVPAGDASASEAERAARTDAAARAAGLALNDLEAALARAFQQPRAGRHADVGTAMTADATLRRISARLSALRFTPGESAPGEAAWRAWIVAALDALSAGAPPPAPPEAARGESLTRLVAQVDLLAETLLAETLPAETFPAETLRPRSGAAD